MAAARSVRDIGTFPVFSFRCFAAPDDDANSFSGDKNPLNDSRLLFVFGVAVDDDFFPTPPEDFDALSFVALLFGATRRFDCALVVVVEGLRLAPPLVDRPPPPNVFFSPELAGDGVAGASNRAGGASLGVVSKKKSFTVTPWLAEGFDPKYFVTSCFDFSVFPSGDL
jgi:hypothetical protein